jgi:UDPglucose 6-dehydrogenase
MKIAIVGAGYVGLVTGTCLAQVGHTVYCVDNDVKKIAQLKKGNCTIYEPGLPELIRQNLRKKRLHFTSRIQDAVKSCQVIFIAVGTPSLPSGEADLTYIENVARQIASAMKEYRLVVEKSTVPVETGTWVKRTIATYVRGRVEFDVASNPEFLREGSAVEDFMKPDRIVLGVESARAKELLEAVYKPFKAPLVITDIKSAELIKHASNSFLATKISFINAVSRVCDKVGADVAQVAFGMGLDRRIGPGFLQAGIGYGGSCFPKDLDAFITISEKIGYDFKLLKAVREINRQQYEIFIEKARANLWILKGKTIAVLGISFKPETDDIRNAPALDVIRALCAEGAKVKVYDPCAMPRAKQELPAKGITYCANAYETCRNSDCLLLLTDWKEFKEMNLEKVKTLLSRPLIIDGRNMFDPRLMAKKGFNYVCMGRS